MDQFVDILVAVEGRWGEAQPLGTAPHGRIVDGLNVDAETLEQPIANPFAAYRIPHHHGNDVARIVEMRSTGSIEPPADKTNAFAQAATFGPADL